MKPNKPKQHVHNWKIQIRNTSSWVDIKDVTEEGKWKQYSPGGFYARRFWACIRGGKIKHIRHTYQVNWEKRKIEKADKIFISASGVPYDRQITNY